MSYNPNEAAQTYRRRNIETADPIGLIVCVLEVAGESLAKARAAIAAGNPAAKAQFIDRASRSISLLQSCLDMSQGEISQNLDRLYIYMQQRISFGHLHNDDDALKEVAGHVSEMTAAWRQSATRKPQVPAQSTQPVEAAAR